MNAFLTNNRQVVSIKSNKKLKLEFKNFFFHFPSFETTNGEKFSRISMVRRKRTIGADGKCGEKIFSFHPPTQAFDCLHGKRTSSHWKLSIKYFALNTRCFETSMERIYINSMLQQYSSSSYFCFSLILFIHTYTLACNTIVFTL